MASDAYEIRPIDLDEAGIVQITSLLQLVFPGADHFTEQVIRWQYVENPDGHAVGFNAWKDGTLAAHYVTIPLKARLFGDEVNALLSLNTATHPEHRGKGLFTQLADATYAAAAKKGFSCVVGVANANSTHGFTRKLGFQLVSPLQAMVGVGRLPVRPKQTELQFAPVMHPDKLFWRLAHPMHRYTVAAQKGATVVLSEKHMKKARFILWLSPVEGQSLNLEKEPMPLIKTFIGLAPNMDWRRSLYLNVPKKLRPAPLNFIFKDLTDQGRILTKGRVEFQAIDFDTL